MNYCTYLRVSTQKQGRSGLGLDAQRKMCADFINARGGMGIEEFIDVESGTHRNRKGLQNAIAYCKQHSCPLVIAKLDRLARDVEFCFKVVNTGIEIHFCDMPQMNTLLLGVFAAVAQYERELTSDRTKKALAVKKAQGAKLGAASEIYKLNRSKKTKEELKEIEMRKGLCKRSRYQESRDVQVFLRVLRNVFPDATHGEPQEWDWKAINTKDGKKDEILSLMADYKGLDESGMLFRKWNFSASDKTLLVKLCAYIQTMRRTFNI